MAEFVQLSRVIVQAYLGEFRPASRALCDRQGISFADLAYDCIGEVFARDPAGAFIHVHGFAKSLNRPMDQTSDQELLAGFRALLSAFADAQIARLYALSDPAGARIHRNIRECVKRGGNFSLVKDFRGWVLYPTDSPAMDDLPPCDIDALKRDFPAHLGDSRQIPQLLHALHGALLAQYNHRRSIALVDAVQIIKEVFITDSTTAADPLSVPPDESVFHADIGRIRTQVEQSLKEKILLTYVARRKLGSREAEAVFLAYRDVIEDWISGNGKDIALQVYLSRHITLGPDEYESTYRVKMEYLLRIIREEFAGRLMREL
jgi:hypothetical protein